MTESMKTKCKDILETEWYLIKLLFQTDWLLGGLYWLVVLIGDFIPLLNVWIWKLVLDTLTTIYQTKTEIAAIWLYLGLYLGLQMVASLLSRGSTVLYAQIKRKATCHLDCALMEKMASVNVSWFDDPANRDKVEAAKSSSLYVTGNLPWAISTMIQVLVFISSLVLFLSYNWIAGCLFLITYIPGAVLSYRNNIKIDEWSIETIPENRKKEYYKSLLTGAFAAKDLRLYNLAPYYKEKYNTLWDKIRREREKLFREGTVSTFTASLLTYIGIVVMICLSVQAVCQGEMLLGTLALYVGLAQSVGENFQEILENLVCQIEIDVPRVRKVREFLQTTETGKDMVSVSESTPAIIESPSIVFQNVSFRYPGSEEFTIKNLSFTIESGKKAALIGVNGAGKSTVVKLLLGFYTPTSGQILLNGKDIREIPKAEVYRMFSVCFQNVQSYSLTAQENIALSDVERMNDTQAVQAAAQASGADDMIGSWENGYDTEMTRQFAEDGMELSGGQWQKIALARAFFRNAGFVILDEPSSALDPEAEDYIFTSFRKLCRDKGGLLISHRLSSIMMVDEILLLDNGTLREHGTHEQLMQKNGMYAEMYRMQAEKYVGGTHA